MTFASVDVLPTKTTGKTRFAVVVVVVFVTALNETKEQIET